MHFACFVWATSLSFFAGQFQGIVAFAVTAGDVFRISPFVVVAVVQTYRHRDEIADFLRASAAHLAQIPSAIHNAWQQLRSKAASDAGHRGTLDGSLRTAKVSGRKVRLSERADAFAVPFVGSCSDSESSMAEYQ